MESYKVFVFPTLVFICLQMYRFSKFSLAVESIMMSLIFAPYALIGLNKKSTREIGIQTNDDSAIVLHKRSIEYKSVIPFVLLGAGLSVYTSVYSF